MMHIWWAPLSGHSVGKAGKSIMRPRFSPLIGRLFLVSKRTFYLFWGVIWWMLHIGRARHLGPGPRVFIPGQLSIEFINVGGWLTSGDMALDSCAQFLAVAEHRLIPSRARSICHQLRKAGHHSVLAPACQDKIAGGHAGVGVISLGGALMSLPSFVTPRFQEFFRLGRVLRTTLPTPRGGVVHLSVVYGYQGAEDDAEKLRLTDSLLQALLVEAHAGVGVVSLGGAPLALPSFVTPEFREFFRLGRALRTTLPTGKGGVVHLFVVYGCQGAEEDAEKLRLTDRLLQAVLAEAQVVCVGQPMLIAGDVNADSGVIPCLAKGIAAGRFVVLALAYSLGAGVAPDVTCRFSQEEGTGSRRDFFVGLTPDATCRFCRRRALVLVGISLLVALMRCVVTDRWFTLTSLFIFQFLLASV